MARKHPERPIIPPPPAAAPAAPTIPPRIEVNAKTIALVCQLAQDGIAALLAKGVPMSSLEGHATALAMLQRQVGMTTPPKAAAASAAKPS